MSIDFILQALSQKKLAKSYLLIGNDHDAKLNFTKELSKILNCKNKSSTIKACKVCQNCQWIENDNHPKVPLTLAVEDSNGKKNIKISELRKLQEELVYGSDYFRVIVIEDVHFQVLNRHSVASLLKTIEEAKSNIIFLLMAQSPEVVIPTIKSRSQILNLGQTESFQPDNSVNGLVKEFNQFNKLQDPLAITIFSEKLAGEEKQTIIELFEFLQKDYSQNLLINSLVQAQKIISLDNALKKIKAFVRVKSVIHELLNEIARIERSCSTQSISVT